MGLKFGTVSAVTTCMNASPTTRQMINIATNALLERIESEGCHYGTIQIQTGLNLGRGKVAVLATVETVRVDDDRRFPHDVIISSTVASGETVAVTTVDEPYGR